MYLFDYARSDGASMYAQFIHAVYQISSGVDLPKRIRFESQGEYHNIMAQNLNIQLDSIGIERVPSDVLEQPSLIDWLSTQAVALARTSLSYPVEAPTLQLPIGVANIVSFTEFCVLDISVANEHFRQLFYLGQAASPCIRREKRDLPTEAPYLGLRFTLHPTVFNSRVVKLKEVEQALQHLQRYVSKEFEVTAKEHHDYGFTMIIEPTEPPPAQALSERLNAASATELASKAMLAMPA